jgi:hypothetical protein
LLKSSYFGFNFNCIADITAIIIRKSTPRPLSIPLLPNLPRSDYSDYLNEINISLRITLKDYHHLPQILGLKFRQPSFKILGAGSTLPNLFSNFLQNKSYFE